MPKKSSSRSARSREDLDVGKLTIGAIFKSMPPKSWLMAATLAGTIIASAFTAGMWVDDALALDEENQRLRARLKMAATINGYWASDEGIRDLMVERFLSSQKDGTHESKGQPLKDMVMNYIERWPDHADDVSSVLLDKGKHHGFGAIRLSDELGKACVPAGLTPKNLNSLDQSSDI